MLRFVAMLINAFLSSLKLQLWISRCWVDRMKGDLHSVSFRPFSSMAQGLRNTCKMLSGLSFLMSARSIQV